MGSTIGEKIKEARIRKGLTQTELGNMLGIQKAAIAKYENGRVVNIKRAALVKLADILDLPPYDLIMEDNPTELPSHAESDNEEYNPSTTAKRLKEIMQEKNLRQVDVLKLAEPICRKYKYGISKSDISQFVNGKVKPGTLKLVILAEALNVSEGWLMGLDVPRIAKEIGKETPSEPVIPLDQSSESKVLQQEPMHILSDDEDELLIEYRKLNTLGKGIALTTLHSFAGNPDLQKK